jgi:subtilisin family serine protease
LTKALTLAFAACTLVVAAVAPAVSVAADQARPYVVVYDTPPGASFPVRAETAARERALGFRSNRRYSHVLDGFAARLTAEEVRALRADPEVAFVSPDRLMHAARVPLSANETVPTGVARIGAAGPAGVHPPSGAPVAVLDTGIDLSHPGLVAHPGANCIGSGLPEDDSLDSHGTLVAGVIGARNEGSGVVGVAPGTELYAVKVLAADGAGSVDDVICGINWLTANAAGLGIRVANMSLSRDIQSAALHLAIQRSASTGIVYTAAAGNSAQDVAHEIPGEYPEVLTVTAMSDTDGAPGGAGPPCGLEGDDRLATFSNYATRPQEIAHVVAAPGVCIESTAQGGGLGMLDGTSASSPHVAGVVAVCMGEAGRPGPCADMSPAEVIEQARAEAAANATPQNGFLGDPFSPVGGRFYGHLISAVDPAVRRIPHRPAPTVTTVQQVKADTTLDVLELRIARRQDVDHLSVVVRLAEAGTVKARARMRLPGGAARLILSRRAVASAAPNQTRRLRLRLRRADLHRVKRALRRGARVRARVRVRVSDSAGNARTRTRRVRLRD